MYTFTTDENNRYIDMYNECCRNGIPAKNLIATPKKAIKKSGYTLHHIYPISFRPDLENDIENHVYLTFEDHADAHYYLWKALKTEEAAMAFWFIYLYGKKYRNYTIPDEDDTILREDVSNFLRDKRSK